MVAYAPRLFGRPVKEQAHPHGAIGAAIQVGTRIVKPPIAVARVLAKLAAGPAVLTSAELDHLPLLNVSVVDATGEMKEARAKELMGKNLNTAWINAELAAIGQHYRATEPVTVLNYYAPAS